MDKFEYLFRNLRNLIFYTSFVIISFIALFGGATIFLLTDLILEGITIMLLAGLMTFLAPISYEKVIKKIKEEYNK